jgi:thiamine biosynthesis lipoprotein
MEAVQLALEAMATRFEIVLQGPSARTLRAAGEEALAEIERVERQLSLYIPESEIARVNTRAAFEPVCVSPPVFALLKQARQLSEATQGAFDVTLAPLVRSWGFMGGDGAPPDVDELRQARQSIGFHNLLLDESGQTVRFARAGAMIDLGAIGKGFAIDRAAAVLREAGVERALLHGGTSTVCAMGQPFDADAWKVVVDMPTKVTGRPAFAPEDVLAVVPLRDETLSVSAVWGRSFSMKGRLCGHVMDPRTGEPVNGAVLAALALPSATETDALSTALLVMGASGLDAIGRLRSSARAFVVTPRGAEWEIARCGL